MDWEEFEKFISKRVVVVKKDGYLKTGVFTGYTQRFIFLEFNDGSPVSISQDEIEEIRMDKEAVG